MKRAEEDAGIIEQRAAETSAELIRAGNQLISLEIKEKALNDRQDYVNKVWFCWFLQTQTRESNMSIIRAGDSLSVPALHPWLKDIMATKFNTFFLFKCKETVLT